MYHMVHQNILQVAKVTSINDEMSNLEMGNNTYQFSLDTF